MLVFLHLNTVGIDNLLWFWVVDKCDITSLKVVMGIFVTCYQPFLLLVKYVKWVFFSLVNWDFHSSQELWFFKMHCFIFHEAWSANTVEALISDHLGNSKNWLSLELVAYKNMLS